MIPVAGKERNLDACNQKWFTNTLLEDTHKKVSEKYENSLNEQRRLFESKLIISSSLKIFRSSKAHS